MSNEARALLLQPDGDLRPVNAPVRKVDDRVAEPVPFAIVEEFYKRPGGTLASRVLGSDPVSYTHLDVYKRQGLCCADRAL